MRSPGKDKVIIGWSEQVEFPDWKIRALVAKVDTGAKTSALHVEDLLILKDGCASFFVVLSRKDWKRRVHVVAPVIRRGRVRSSSGHYSSRCFVNTRIRIGEIEKEIEISLVSREKMVFRMLIGRKALEKDFLVDVSRRHVRTKTHSGREPLER